MNITARLKRLEALRARRAAADRDNICYITLLDNGLWRGACSSGDRVGDIDSVIAWASDRADIIIIIDL